MKNLNLVGQFVFIEGFGDETFYVSSKLGYNQFEMISTSSKKAYGIDTDAQPVEVITKLRQQLNARNS